MMTHQLHGNNAMPNKEKILVIDDSREMLLVMKHLLLNHGYTPFLAENGLAGLKMVEENNPDLIVLDLNMPIMNGIAFLDAYRSDPELKHIPSIVLTTSDEERDRRQSYAIGIAGYILKPVGFNEFVDAVRQIDGYWSLCELPVAG